MQWLAYRHSIQLDVSMFHSYRFPARVTDLGHFGAEATLRQRIASTAARLGDASLSCYATATLAFSLLAARRVEVLGETILVPWRDECGESSQ